MFKVGDKIICVVPGDTIYSNLNCDSIYTIEEVSSFKFYNDNTYNIRINNGKKIFFKSSRFISIKEQRARKLKQLICSK